MPTPDRLPDLEELTSTRPDNVYFDTKIVNWEFKASDGERATYGLIQPGVNEIIEVAPGGEIIQLVRPNGTKGLIIEAFDEAGESAQIETLTGYKRMEIPGGTKIRIMTPQGQGPIEYVCEYPGT